MGISTILVIIAVVLFAAAALNVGSPSRVALGWAGLAFWAASTLV